MSINSTQIRDGFGHELRVMRGKAPILKNAGLIPIQYWLTNRHFFEKQEKYLGPTLQDLRKPTSAQANVSSNMALIKQRFLALMAGYEDLNDHDALAMDDGFRVAVGGELASCATLCRFERSIPQETIDKGNEFLRDFYLQHGTRKKTIIIDVDNTPVETFGLQEGRKFNGQYDCNCYLPLLAFIDGYPIGIYNGTIDGRKRMLEVLKMMVDAIKRSVRTP